jgi:YVTN family beta-propeller protein
MCITDARARVFVAGGGESYVAAFGGESDRRVGMWTNWSYTMAIYADAHADKLYCLSYPSQVIVVDPTTNRRVAGIAVEDYPVAVCFNTVDRKVYVASDGGASGALQVLDGIGDSLLTEIDVACTPSLLVFNPHDDILYAADPGNGWISAISGKTDSVVGYDFVSERPVGLVYNELQGKLYSFGSEGTVTVMKPDLSGESGRIPVAEGIDLFALSSVGRYLYCGDRDLNLVYVIDCMQDRLACVIPVEAPLASLYCPSYENRLYCGSLAEELYVIDCVKNGLVGIAPVSADLIYADSATDAIYCLTGDELAVVDGETRTVMRTLDLGSYASDLASASNWQYVYAADEGEPYLLAVRKASGPAEMAVRAAPDAQATIVQGRLDWTGTLSVMYDKSGRRIADVHRGGNDVSGLNPGVYFIRQTGVPRGTFARKVVIAR